MPLAPDGEPARGVAFVELPPDADINWYYGESRPHVYMAAEFEQNGNNRIFMLSGYLKDLEKLRAEAPHGHVQLITAGMGALHCPDLQFMSDLLGSFLNDISIRDPKIPLLCGVGGEQSKTSAQLKTGDNVRRSILENYVAPVGSFRQIIAALDERDMEMVLAVGSALPVGVPPCPFPVLQVNVPDDIGQIMTMIYDLGIAVGG
jgi:[acyl-carrier-protein] S-malonyltransferase